MASDDSVFAFAPAVLNSDISGRMRKVAFNELRDEATQFTAATAQQSSQSGPIQAPRRILLEGLSLLLRNLPSDLLKRQRDLTVEGLMYDEDIVDATFSPDGRSLAVISKDSAGSTRIKVGTMNWSGKPRAFGFVDSPFPSTVSSGDRKFTPWRLYFYPIGDNEEGMVVFPHECTPSVAFYNPIDQTWEIKRLAMEKLLCLSQTEDRRRTCLLDVDGICILDLPAREIVGKIAYQVDFTALPEGQIPVSFYRDLMVSSPCFIADDGKTIVLPWASDDRPHTVVTPSMDPAEWNLVLRCRKTDTVRSSAVSRNGKCVASIVQRGAQKPSIAIESLIGKIDACESTHGLSLDSLRL